MNKVRTCFIGIILCIYLNLFSQCNAVTYEISNFEGSSESLIGPMYKDGDLLQIIKDLTATSDISRLHSGSISINGGFLSFNGNDGTTSHSGFVIQNTDSLFIEKIGSTHFDNNGNLVINSSVNGFSTSTDGAVFNNAGQLEIKDSVFVNNSAAQKGGVLYNSGTSSVSNSIFKENSASSGGAVYNSGTTTISNSRFEANKAAYQGGALYNEANKTLNIDNSDFVSNTATNFGGAIFNAETLNVANSRFNSNHSDKSGGAVYNDMWSNANIKNSDFTDNSATESGGALYNVLADMDVSNTNFTRNSAGKVGGAIANYDNLSVVGSSFSNNTAETGGAIGNVSGTSTITGGTFINNTAQQKGGAIYNNRGTVNLIANSNDIEFTGNKANNVSNAIFIENGGSVNLNAGKGQIIFNDVISSLSGENKSNILNINKTLSTSSTDGRIVLNNALTGFNGTGNAINIYNSGTLKLGSYTDAQGNTSYGSIGSDIERIKNFNMNDNAVLDLTNGSANDVVYVENLGVTNSPSVWTDVDLTNSISDKLNISGNVSTTPVDFLNFKNFKVKDGPTATVQVIDGTNLPNIAVSDTYTNRNIYAVTNNNDGTLTFTQSSTLDGLKAAIANTGERSFSLNDNYMANGDLNNVVGNSTLTVFGEDKLYSISGGNNYKLFSIEQNGTLNIFDTIIERAVGNGGAIANNGNINLYNTEISNNINSGSSSFGGAISNVNAKANIYNSDFKNNHADIGGAIYNFESDTNIYNSKFNNNVSLSTGGAIYNQGRLNIFNSEFTDNKAGNGGALYNVGETVIENSKFSGNHGHLGGAIYNEVVTLNIKNSSFINNSADTTNAGDGKGGAIYNKNGVVNLVADNGNIEFTGNITSATSTSNAMHIADNGKVNLNAGNGQIIFNDRITSEGDNNVININQAAGIDGVLADTPNYGTIVLNEDMSGFGNHTTTLAPALGNTVNLYGGTLKIGENGTFFKDVAFNMNNNSTLDMMNNKLDNLSLSSFNIGGNSNLRMDMDLKNQIGDYISADASTGNGILTIKNINLISDAPQATIDVAHVDSGLANKVVLDASATTALSPIYKYNVAYDNTMGQLNFVGAGFGGNPSDSFNPAILATPVAAQVGSYLTQVNSYLSAFGNMDMAMLMTREQRQALKFRNKYAAADEVNPMVFSPTFLPEEERGGWFRPFTTFENVPLKNGPKVSNILYGSLAGYDSELIDLGHGFDGIFTGYVGYNGSHQTYDSVGIYQNGGLLGATGVVYKGNFFSGLTANVGANCGEASTMYGNDNFTMLTAGVASKTGYNWELFEGKFIVQPSYLMSYTFVNTFNYRNAAGISISSEPLNAIQISPGLKFIWNLKNNWQPYIGVNMVWNIIDKTRFNANDVALPQLSVKPYIEYGVGVQKKWGERFTGFAQAMIRNGGRNGIGLQFGFRWTF